MPPLSDDLSIVWEPFTVSLRPALSHCLVVGAGHLLDSIVIGADGCVVLASAKGGAFPDNTLPTCVCARRKPAQVLPPKGGGIVIVDWPTPFPPG